MGKEQMDRREFLKMGVVVAGTGILAACSRGNEAQSGQEAYQWLKEGGKGTSAYSLIAEAFKSAFKTVYERQKIPFPPKVQDAVNFSDLTQALGLLSWQKMGESLEVVDSLKSIGAMDEVSRLNLGEAVFKMPQISPKIADVTQQVVPDWEGRTKGFPAEGVYLVKISVPYNYTKGTFSDRNVDFCLSIALIPAVKEGKGDYFMSVRRFYSPYVDYSFMPRSLDSLLPQSTPTVVKSPQPTAKPEETPQPEGGSF